METEASVVAAFARKARDVKLILNLGIADIICIAGGVLFYLRYSVLLYTLRNVTADEAPVMSQHTRALNRQDYKTLTLVASAGRWSFMTSLSFVFFAAVVGELFPADIPDGYVRYRPSVYSPRGYPSARPGGIIMAHFGDWSVAKCSPSAFAHGAADAGDRPAADLCRASMASLRRCYYCSCVFYRGGDWRSAGLGSSWPNMSRKTHRYRLRHPDRGIDRRYPIVGGGDAYQHQHDAADVSTTAAGVFLFLLGGVLARWRCVPMSLAAGDADILEMQKRKGS